MQHSCLGEQASQQLHAIAILPVMAVQPRPDVEFNQWVDALVALRVEVVRDILCDLSPHGIDTLRARNFGMAARRANLLGELQSMMRNSATFQHTSVVLFL